MGATAEAVQFNTRIDRELKAQGDSSLARAGFTPTEAVRALYRIAVRFQSDPQSLARYLAMEQPENAARDDEEIARRRAAHQEIHELYEKALEQLGIPADAPSPTAQLSYDELREMALLERLEERGLT